ncbi:hypothetical protein [Henriciella sp.]|uniref:hypothetical protein n=1 Tax=Henriciella sp. TaxID=1968823 RepID=UPI00260BD822|nr:hypothetical protein [Henriciella sp.]
MSSCASRAPEIDTEFFSTSEIQAATGAAYAVGIQLQKRNGTMVYRTYSLGGDVPLPVQEYDVECSYVTAQTEVRIHSLNDGPAWTCPEFDPGVIVSGAQRLTGRSLVVDLYRDDEREFYHRYEGRLLNNDSPITVAFTFRETMSFNRTLAAVLHEVFHIHDNALASNLQSIQEEINADLFGMCVVVPSPGSRYSAEVFERSEWAMRASTIVDESTGERREVRSRSDLELLLRAMLEYNEVYQASDYAEVPREVQFVYSTFSELVFRYLAYYGSDEPTTERFEALCSSLWRDNFSQPLTMEHIESADAVSAAN